MADSVGCREAHAKEVRRIAAAKLERIAQFGGHAAEIRIAEWAGAPQRDRIVPATGCSPDFMRKQSGPWLPGTLSDACIRVAIAVRCVAKHPELPEVAFEGIAREKRPDRGHLIGCEAA